MWSMGEVQTNTHNTILFVLCVNVTHRIYKEPGTHLSKNIIIPTLYIHNCFKGVINIET